MLQDLMRVHDVDAAILEIEGVSIVDLEVDHHTAFGSGSAGSLDDVGRRVDPAACDQERPTWPDRA